MSLFRCVGFLICHNFKLEAMTSFHAEKRCHLVSEHEASDHAAPICFSTFSTFDSYTSFPQYQRIKVPVSVYQDSNWLYQAAMRFFAQIADRRWVFTGRGGCVSR